MKVVLKMETISIESKMSMEAVGAPANTKTEMAVSHFPPPVPALVELSEAEEMDAKNTSPELVIMAPHSNVYDDRPNTDDSLYGVITTNTTKEASAENPVSGQGSQL